MVDYLEGELTQLCQMVYLECKPCAMIPIRKNHLEDSKIICKRESCNYIIKDIYQNENWSEFWIYKRKEIKEIINLLPKEPKTALDHYLLGALFGYSYNAICDYLNLIDEI